MLLPSACALMEKLASASGASGAGWHWEALGGSWRHKEGSGGGSHVGSRITEIGNGEKASITEQS